MKNKIKPSGAKRFAVILSTLAATCLAGNLAQAHLSYTGRNFGAFFGLTPASVSINNQAVTGNFGWADAADGILGDSHKARAFRFHLDTTATIGLTVSANSTATGTSIGGLLPAFSIYSGLAAVTPFSGTQTSSDHDTSLASEAWRTWWVQQNLNPLATDSSPTDGNWNALGDWKIGGDGDVAGDFSQLSSLLYQGSAFDADLDGSVFGSFLLGPGDYTIMIGGNDLANKTAGNAASGFGLAATLSVTPVPEPTALVLVGVGALLLSRTARRRTV